MKNDLIYNTGCSIYPGDYTPLLKGEEIDIELRNPHEGKMLLPPVNITEQADSYKIDVAIPGVRREDFLVKSEANILSVRVLNKECGYHGAENFQLHEFNYQCFDRHIILPENADPEFTSAEYKAGILRFYIPKTNCPDLTHRTRIVIY